ncbi:MAG: hypothetical protein N2688_07110 [Burkholderiaceae bacterium]|nr:hypothetical protein [Burkholderiaceae bacterium]
MRAAELAAEDALRLNVLLAGEVLAVRIDEGARVLHALTPKGEARVALHPVGNPDRYFQRVRELLGGHAFGLRDGYPLHLRRWTRLGQASAQTLAALLKIGEPEALLAVAQAEGLSEELARRVWWAGQPAPPAELARALLAQPAVRAGALGAAIAAHLLENLPFETDADAAMHTVRALLASGRLDSAQRERLWQRAQQRAHYLIGFLEHLPDALPAAPPRPLPAGLPDTPAARLLARCYAGSGQAYLRAAELALEKPPTHECVYRALDLLGGYFADGPQAGTLPVPEQERRALAALARVSQADAEPVLMRTTAVGALMRRHLQPVLDPLIGHLRALRGLP